MDDATVETTGLCDRVRAGLEGAAGAPHRGLPRGWAREPARRRLLRELLLLELDYRSRAGQPPASDEYCARFPDFIGVVNACWRTARGLTDAWTGRRDRAAGRAAGGPSAQHRASLQCCGPRRSQGLWRPRQGGNHTWGARQRIAGRTEDDRPSPTPLANGRAAAGGQTNGTLGGVPPPAAPERIGKYVVIELLDEGGQSLVYRPPIPTSSGRAYPSSTAPRCLPERAAATPCWNRESWLPGWSIPHLTRCTNWGSTRAVLHGHAVRSRAESDATPERPPLTHPQQAALGGASGGGRSLAAHGAGHYPSRHQACNIHGRPGRSAEADRLRHGVAPSTCGWRRRRGRGLSGTPQ